MAVVGKKSAGEKSLHTLNVFVLTVVTIIFAYPMWHCLMASFSDPINLIGYKGMLLLPNGFSLKGYSTVFKNANFLVGYMNTGIYVISGTVFSMALTILGAYVLSRKRLAIRKPLSLFIIFTMYIDFGLIPAFLNIKTLGLYNTRWVIILPELINTYNLIVMRTAFASVPKSLEESAMLDGANDFTILTRILLPVSKATMAVVILFYAVGQWNSWFPASIYIRDRDKYPLQLFLREILIANSSIAAAGEANSVDGVMYLDELLKYCSIIISTVPILVLYPFVQKYFVVGVMVGSIKE